MDLSINFWKATYFTHSEAHSTAFGSCGTSHTTASHLPIFNIFLVLNFLVFPPQIPSTLFQLDSDKTDSIIYVWFGFSIALLSTIYF